MIRFRVIKAGSLLLAAAIIVLAVVVTVIVVSMLKTEITSAPSAVQVFSDSSTALIPVPINSENEHTDSIAAIPGDIISQVEQSTNGKRILIYHTHTHEAYQPTSGSEYTELEAWRTDDNEYNIVRVGKELAALLEKRGFTVVHDVTDHELDDLSTAYERSLKTLEGRADEDYDLYIDLHRDAYTEGAQLTCAYAGNTSAKLMILIGKGENFSEKPDYKENYALAQEITDAINAICPGMCRDVMVKTGRYNQHISENSLLIEVGNNMNTLSEAIDSMPALADAIYEVLVKPDNNGVITVSYDE